MPSSNLLNRLMKTVAVASAVFFIGLALLVASAVVGQNKKDKHWEEKLAPSIQFVNTFQQKKHRLPSEQEFAGRPSAKTDWMVDLVGKKSTDPAFKSHGGEASADYCVRIWRGESWTYYFSWNKKYDIIEP